MPLSTFYIQSIKTFLFVGQKSKFYQKVTNKNDAINKKFSLDLFFIKNLNG